jgi:hypothetical protein
MTIESIMRARAAARAAAAVVDFEDTAAPIATHAHAGQGPQDDDAAGLDIGHDTAARPVAVSAQDDVVLPVDWEIPPKATKRRKGKGAK